jgi:ABC-2 type transport system ATP-binding protein
VLELVGLTKRYGDVVALDGLSMTVRPGRIHGVRRPQRGGQDNHQLKLRGALAAGAGAGPN